jgi:hypothetical protein
MATRTNTDFIASRGVLVLTTNAAISQGLAASDRRTA